jgi:hypothetical protein
MWKGEVAVRVKTAVAVCGVGLVLSETWTVNVLEPVADGIPEMVPSDERVRPAGREPAAIDQVYG